MAHSPVNPSELANHLNTLYRLAQGLTPDPGRAASLVDATYRRAAEKLKQGAAPADPLLWLRHLLVEEFRRGDYAGPGTGSRLDKETENGFHQRALTGFLNRAFPFAFASLTPPQRSLLLLCKVERLSCADAAEILEMRPDEASAALTDAFVTLGGRLHEQANRVEKQLLDQHLTSTRLKRSLRTFVEGSFQDPPSPLPPLVESTLRQTAPKKLPRKGSPKPLPAKTATAPSDSQSRDSTFLTRARQGVFVVVLIAFAAVVGYGTSTFFQSPPETDVLALSVQQARSVQVQETITQPDHAADFIRNELNIRLTPPLIEGATLQGVNIAEVAPNVRVPVLLYQDEAADQRIPVYAYTYAQLSRHADQLDLGERVLRQIEDHQRVLVQDAAGERSVLVWRHRDKIFVAIPPGNPEELRQRITPGT